MEFRADDKAEIYADGVLLTTINQPFLKFKTTLPDSTRLLAIRGTNIKEHYGFIIKLSNGFITDKHWRCSNTEHDNWNKISYDDHDWQHARPLTWPSDWAQYLIHPAEIIWAEIYTDVVYCRGWPSKL